MVINDLKQVCPQCRGMGFQAGISRMGISEPNVGGKCPKCAGRGFLLTSLGRDLVDLLRPFMAELIEERARARERGVPAGGVPATDKSGGEV
ncbi:MAG: hypothetical protein HY342_12655 [Candidatus Lambdaproteobacteria bacterium]|nr:hypothetical protein [Candidatus Lambdaproteobacteria bacterium]